MSAGHERRLLGCDKFVQKGGFVSERVLAPPLPHSRTAATPAERSHATRAGYQRGRRIGS